MMDVGIDECGTNMRACVVDEQGKLLSRVSQPVGTLKSPEELIRRLSELAQKAVEDTGTPEKQIQSVGVGIPGAVSEGNILYTCNLPLRDVPFEQLFRRFFDRPVYLENDANCAAAGEWLYGAGRGRKNFVMVTLGTGLGGGFILNGKLYGGGGMAGEIGHMRMTETGPVGYGKAGSFEGYCSGGGIAQLGKTYAMEAFQRGETVSYCASPADMDKISAKSIAIAAREGHADAIAVYDRCADKLGAGLAILADILNPERIVLGSIFMRDRALLADRMDAVLRRECLPGVYNALQVVPAELSENIGDVAAITVAAEGLRLSNRAE